MIEGKAPLLLSKSMLKALETKVNLTVDTITLEKVPGCPVAFAEEMR